MVRENVDIVFRENGATIIKRKIDEIGESANRATRGVFLLQRALYVIGGFGILNALQQQVDMLTNVENRLRLTTESTRELQNVQTSLFDIARRSRADFEGVAQTYTRTALSAKALGRSQEEVLTFTESVTKAAIISGASTREINASLIQLGQGIASNRLGGDELRSILEQLPFVADVIAKELGVTRGQLRELGSEGKITGNVILDAFKNSADSINALFAQTQPTIEQSFAVARTNFLEFVDTFDDATGASAKLANAIILISENVDLLVGSIAAVAAVSALSFGASVIGNIMGYVNGIKAGIVQTTSMIARLVDIRAATVANRNAILAENAARQAQLTTNLGIIAQKKVMLQQQIREAEFTVVNGRARNIETGQFVALGTAKANLIRLTTNLNIVEGVEAAQSARLAAARAGQATATNALAGAQGRLAAAQAAQGGLLATLAARFPTLSAVIMSAANAFRFLFGIIAANPIGALITIVAAVGLAIYKWGNNIKVTSDGVVGLKDFFVAAFQIMWEWIQRVGSALSEYFGPTFTIVKNAVTSASSAMSEAFTSAVGRIIDAMIFLPRVITATIVGLSQAWDQIPAAANDAAISAANLFISGFEMLANGAIRALNRVISALNSLLSFVGADKAAELFGFSGMISEISEVSLGQIENNYSGSGKSAVESFTKGFLDTWESTSKESIADAITSPIIDRARTNILDDRSDNMLIQLAERQQALNDAESSLVNSIGDAAGGGGGGGGKSFSDIISSMNKELELLKMTSQERGKSNELLAIEKELKRTLTDQERQIASAMIEKLMVARQEAEIMDRLNKGNQEFIYTQQALNNLLKEGKITMSQYRDEMILLQRETYAAGTTFGSGFKSAIIDATMTMKEFGRAAGDEFVSLISNSADALVEFARTGKLNLKSLFSEFFANLAKLIANQALLSILGPIFGVGASGALTGGGLFGLLGFASGGSILPTGPGSTDSQIVAFAKRPDERVDILTPGQQEAQRNASGGTNVSISIDARGSVEGTDQRIAKALEQALPRISEAVSVKIRTDQKRGKM